MVHILGKPEDLYGEVKIWHKRKIKTVQKDIIDIQCELEALLPMMATNSLPESTRLHIQALELKRTKLLTIEEATWNLKSRAIWIKEGDRNTKIFHRCANHRRNINTIWGINDANGNYIQCREDICKHTASHFQLAYGCNEDIIFEDLIQGIEHYPTMYDWESHDELFKCITEEELLVVLKYFNGDKILGPVGWTVELFTPFFDLFKNDPLDMVEDSTITRNINSTYISLITKRCPTTYFADFRPISVCNLIYKVISKTIVGHMWVILSCHISLEQHGFLQDTQIHDVIANSQECMHSIHTNI